MITHVQYIVSLCICTKLFKLGNSVINDSKNKFAHLLLITILTEVIVDRLFLQFVRAGQQMTNSALK